jgi:hypothetical protein
VKFVRARDIDRIDVIGGEQLIHRSDVPATMPAHEVLALLPIPAMHGRQFPTLYFVKRWLGLTLTNISRSDYSPSNLLGHGAF